MPTGSRGRTWPSVALLALDLTGMAAFLNVAHRARIGEWVSPLSLPMLGSMLILVTVFYVMDLYAIRADASRMRIAVRSVGAVVLCGVVSVGVVYVGGVSRLRDEPLFWRSVYPFGLAALALWASGWRLYFARLVRGRESRRRWLVIGGGERLEQFLSEVRLSELDGRFCLLTDDSVAGQVSPGRVEVVGTLGDLESVLSQPWTEIIVCTDTPLVDDAIEKIMRLRLTGVMVHDVVEFYEKYLLRVPIFHIANTWFVHTEGFQLIHHDIALKIKRVLDIVLATVILVLTAPILALTALLVKLDSRGPVIYRQRRMGARGRVINVLKFRTMFADAETGGAQWASHGDPRVTRVGRWLRLTRIDELPQLWNVARGEMSCIGPRPERPEFTERLEREIPYYDLRHLVTPGITGWAQVMYPYGASIEDARRKLEYDLYYIKNYSLLLDLIIVLKTVRVVVFGRGR